MAIYYIADLHFGHKAAIDFDNRPFASVEEMDAELIRRWNAKVNRGDIVYILGDFCFGRADDWLRIIRKLKGRKVLVKGNHDLKKFPPELEKEFIGIYEYKEIADNAPGNISRKVIMFHYPIMFYRHSNNARYYMLCGHVHATAENDYLEKWTAELKAAPVSEVSHAGNRGQIINVGCMMPWMDYTPRTLSEILERKGA